MDPRTLGTWTQPPMREVGSGVGETYVQGTWVPRCFTGSLCSSGVACLVPRCLGDSDVTVSQGKVIKVGVALSGRDWSGECQSCPAASASHGHSSQDSQDNKWIQPNSGVYQIW